MIWMILIASALGACVGAGAIGLCVNAKVALLRDQRDDARAIGETLNARLTHMQQANRALAADQAGLERERNQADHAARQALDAASEWKDRYNALAEQLAVIPDRDPATGRMRKRERTA